ncbi:MAG: hypothetical protein CBD51_004210 [Flavobacteriales bacterium TMED191]|nr:MAG: hypothetical protein CBD51_004210 [Flavobacteriales bacterium TMED191]
MIFYNSIILNTTLFEFLGCFFLSFFLSFLLYRKHTSLNNVSNLIRTLLFLVRFCIFFLLFLFLFNPKLKRETKVEESPKIVFLQDNSFSIILGDDSLYFKNDYLVFLDSLFSNSRLDIDVFSFDQSFKKGFLDFSGDLTNMSNILEHVSEIYSNQNVGAYILASDGIYNQGLNPLYLKNKYNAPLYTLLIGDTTARKDLLISKIKTNKLSYLGNSFPVEINIQALQMKGLEFHVKVFENTDSEFKKPLFIKKFSIDKSSYDEKIHFFISPKSPGLKSYSVYLESNTDEYNLFNNQDVFHVDIMDDRKKILILYGNHHPDITAIKHSLESFDQYQVETEWVKNFQPSINDYKRYSLIILHQVSELIGVEGIDLYDFPVWYIIGKNSDLALLNQSQNIVKFNNSNLDFEFSNFALNDNFSTFNLSDSLVDFLSYSSSLLVPFLVPEVNSLTDVLLNKQIGSINTNKPILFFAKNQQKSAYLLGEGLWRLKLNDTYLNNSNLLFNSFISKIVQSLLSDDNKKRLHINYNSIQYSNSRISFEGEFYNRNFELINFPELNLEIIDSIGDSYNYKFNRFSSSYYLDVLLSEGSYNFIAKSELNNKVFTDTGSFIVLKPNFESKNTIANFDLLNNLARLNNGYATSIDSLDNLFQNIQQSPNFKVSTYIENSFKSLINFQSLLLLLLLLLFIEWSVRRRYINF